MKKAVRASLLFFVLAALLLFWVPQSGKASQTGRSMAGLSPAAYLPMILNGSIPPEVAGCPIFPGDNVWNTPVDTLPVLAQSQTYVASLGANSPVHADFGQGLWDNAPIGIPYIVVPGAQPRVAINFTAYGKESDPGPYPFPANAPIEGAPNTGGDRHSLVIDQGACKLYELYRAFPQSNGSWNADSGAVYDLKANGPLRTAGWTSADAAGLPIFAGLARYDEAASGEIRHALRFTANCTQNTYIWPARHKAGSCNTNYPPMGQRFRLKAGVNIAQYPAQAQIVLRALQKYGMILADNGSSWFLSGTPDERWNNDQLHSLGQLHGSDFEAVDGASLMLDPNSGQARLR